MVLTVYNKNMDPLYTGTKQECINYMRLNRLNKRIHTIAPPPKKVPTPTINVETTSFEQPKGFFKRIFKTNE